MRSILAHAVLLIVCAGFLCSCSPSETPAKRAAREGVLLLGNGAEPATLDPALATGLTEVRIIMALFEGLVGFDASTLEPVPAAAESWTVSADGKTYTFKISPSAVWSSGRRVKARDFLYAWRRAVNPALGAEYASMFLPVENAEEILKGKLPPESLGVEAPADDVFVVRLKRPVPYFLSMLCCTVFYPVPEEVVEKFGGALSRNGKWALPQNMVSNGGFTLKKWVVGDSVRVERNPDYRDAKNILLSAIEFFPVDNMNTEERSFRAGQLHMTNSVAHSRIEAARREGNKYLRISPWLGVYYYLINTQAKPLDDVRVRRALSMSIDRRSIIENLLKGGQKPAFSFVPDSCGGYKARALVGEDAAAARKLLAEAGYANPKDLGKIRLSYNTSELHKPIAEAVQQMWSDSLGIEAELYNLSWPAYLDDRRNRNYMITRSSWIGDFDAPESFLENFLSTSGLNHSGFASKEFDSLMDSAGKAKTFGERMEFLSRAEEVLMRECPVIPIYFYTRIYLASPMVKGWAENILDWQNFKGVSLDPDAGLEEPSLSAHCAAKKDAPEGQK